MYMCSPPNSSDHSARTFWWQANAFYTVTDCPNTTQVWLMLLWSPRNAFLLHPSCFLGFFCTLRSSISLVPGSSWTVPVLHNCALQTEARIKGIQIIRKSEQWKVSDLSIFSQLGRWLLKNHKCTLKMRGSEVQLSKHSLAFMSVSELFTGMAKSY